MIKNKILTLIISLVTSVVLILTLVAVYDFSVGSEKIYNKDTDVIINSIQKIIELKVRSIENLIDYTMSNSEINDISEGDIRSKMVYMYGEASCKSIYLYNDINKSMMLYPNSNIGNASFENMQWYESAKNFKDKVFITDVYDDEATGEKVVSIGKAIMENEEFKGVICANYNLRDLFSDISNIKFGDSGQIIILDKNGVIVSCTDNHLIGSSDLFDEDEAKIGLFKKSLIKQADIDYTSWKIILQMPTKEYNKSRNDFIKVMFIVMILLILISSFAASFLARKMAKKINLIKDGINRGSKGNFSELIEVNSKDEFGSMSDSFNNMQSNISTLISVSKTSAVDVNKSSEKLYRMSAAVSKSMNDISEAITEIAKGGRNSTKSLDVLLDNLDDVSNQISNINELSGDIGTLSYSTSSLSKKGEEIINIVMQKSYETKESTANVTESVLNLERSMRNIAIFNETISEITEQTNLLALNAAIEAARAGIAGEGFAVVAEEIRSLSEETAVSAKNIDDVIKEVITNVSSVVNQVKDTSDIVEIQQKSVLDAKEVFDDINYKITDLVEKFNNIIKLIYSVSENKENIILEAHNISVIVKKTAVGTEEVTAASQEVSASIEEIVSFSNKLNELSDILSNEINKFKLKENN